MIIIIIFQCKNQKDCLINKSIKSLAASNNGLAPTLNYISIKSLVKIYQSYLKQNKLWFTHKKVVNICIAYKAKRFGHLLLVKILG